MVRMRQICCAVLSTAALVMLQSGMTAQERSNGIAVGRPKVFDNRTLALMLENLSETLRQIQVVDQAKIAAAFGLLQGFQSREVSSNFSVTTTPTPATSRETVTNTGLVNENREALPDTTTDTTTTETASVSPQVPSLDAVSPLAGFSPQFGQNPSDLLSDQVSLSYQIFNLRMILERSLSDRLRTDADPPGQDEPRLQAVLGFNVTIDPPRTAEEAVAVVEVTLEAQGELDRGQLRPASSPDDNRFSLVALMPQEKTYNSAALSTKSSAFGGAAVAGMFNVGYTQRRRGQTFYLYRDADTTAYQHMQDDAKGLTFGWTFRPVLGQKAVSPGMRQMFAVIALPKTDTSAADPTQLMKATVRTYWKKYDANTRTSFEEADANRGARTRYFLSLGLGRPEIFSSRYLNEATYSNVEVWPTAKYEAGLAPVIESVRWELVGPKAVVVTAAGRNLFTGTRVVIGDKTYATPADGLLLKSVHSFDLTTTLDALESGRGMVIGRYGGAVPLSPTSVSALPAATTAGSPMSVTIGPELAGMRELRVVLPTSAAPPPNGLGRQPLLSINSQVLAPPYYSSVLTPGPGGATGESIQIITHASASSFEASGAIVKLTWPFLPQWTLLSRSFDPATAYHVTRLADRTLLLQSNNLDGFADPSDVLGQLKPPPVDRCWTLFAGGEPIRLRTARCPNGSASTLEISAFAVQVTLANDVPDRVLLRSPLNAVFALELKKAPDPPAAVSPEVGQHDAVWIDVPVKAGTVVASVEANGRRLGFRPLDPKDKSAKTMKVQLTREETKEPGLLEVTLLDAAGKPVGQSRIRVRCTQCGEKGDD